MKAVLLLAAYVSCVLGWACIALSMESHRQPVRAAAGPPGRLPIVLRTLGTMAALASLLLCLRADRASMAALVWVLTLTAGALTVSFALTARRLRQLRIDADGKGGTPKK